MMLLDAYLEKLAAIEAAKPKPRPRRVRLTKKERKLMEEAQRRLEQKRAELRFGRAA